jgi:hypothetical protein
LSIAVKQFPLQPAKKRFEFFEGKSIKGLSQLRRLGKSKKGKLKWELERAMNKHQHKPGQATAVAELRQGQSEWDRQATVSNWLSMSFKLNQGGSRVGGEYK